jgi:3-oxoacyl-[acyl-carrier-protein] synthase III
MASSAPDKTPIGAPAGLGVRLAGTGVGLPANRLTNAELEKLMDTSDEWIVQRTGIRERRKMDRAKGERATTLAARAVEQALESAGREPGELDLVLCGTVSMEMTCPSTACQVINRIGANGAAALDVSAACCGFLYSLNLAYTQVRSGLYKRAAVIGVDTLTDTMEYTTRGRGTAILFGDGAGAAVIEATDDPSRGVIAQKMHADGSLWKHLYIPRDESDFPEDEPFGADQLPMGAMRMNGREVFRFAVKTFGDLIQETLDEAGVSVEDVAHFVCHQSNLRILQAARERFGLPEEKLFVNIDRFGNTSSASVPICLHELHSAGKIAEGELVMFVAFGGGMTWASSLWRV